MEVLLRKLNYKGQKRIALINAPEGFYQSLAKTIPDTGIDIEIDPRYPYEFMIIYVRFVCEIESIAPQALHNLVTDGILWFAYPKKTSRLLTSDIYRNHGWEVVIDRGFEGVRQVILDENWSAIRFRNVRFIKSGASGLNR